MMSLRHRLLLLTAGVATLNSCATTNPVKVSSSDSRCCLVDPGHGALLMPDNPQSKVALETWVNKNAGHLSIRGGAKPRFILLHISKDFTIKDQMPLADQKSPGAVHNLTTAEVASLRACFKGGKMVKVDWVSKRVQPATSE